MRNVECGMRNCTRSSACSPNRRDDDCHELTRLVPQTSHAHRVAQSTLDNQIEPELRLIRLLLNDPQLCKELPAGPRAACGPIVRPHGRTGSQELIPNHVRRTASREGFNQGNDRQCKGPRTILKVNPAHDFTLTFRIPHSAFRASSAVHPPIAPTRAGAAPARTATRPAPAPPPLVRPTRRC